MPPARTPIAVRLHVLLLALLHVLLLALLHVLLLALLPPVPVFAAPDAVPAARSDGPTSTYHVRSPRALPAVAGLEVLSREADRYVVTADPAAIESLRRAGCFVAPFDAARGGQSEPPTAAPRTTAPRRWQTLRVPDPLVQGMVDQVDWSGVAATITWLQDFQTRYSFSPQCDAAADSLVEVLTGHGLPTVKRPFTYQGNAMDNVEATQLGTVYPDSIFIICGHYDSYSEDPMILAPGADDNASGSTAVLTAAEILSQHTFEYTIKYVLFAAEEQGLIGSSFYAQYAASMGWAITGVLNFDMIGWWEPGVPFDLEIETNHDSYWLAEVITSAADLYTSMVYELHVYDGAWWGDHYPFWLEGYAAVNHEESWDWGDPDFNPYYHSTLDLVDFVDPGFAVGNVQVAVAALATLARPDASTGVAGSAPHAPAMTLAASPNPFGGEVTLSVTAPRGGAAVHLGIYDVLGRLVDTVAVPVRGGRGETRWRLDGAAAGARAAAVFFCRPLAGPEQGGAQALRIVHLP